VPCHPQFVQRVDEEVAVIDEVGRETAARAAEQRFRRATGLFPNRARPCRACRLATFSGCRVSGVGNRAEVCRERGTLRLPVAEPMHAQLGSTTGI
jgi:hypothetical protein